MKPASPYGGEALPPFFPTLCLERYGGIAKCPLGADDALGDGGFRKQEGAGDLGRRQPA
jgi:hypothetical protein